MSTVLLMEDIENLLRTVDKGMNLAYKYDTRFIDVFQNILDQLEYIRKEIKQEY